MGPKTFCLLAALGQQEEKKGRAVRKSSECIYQILELK